MSAEQNAISPDILQSEKDIAFVSEKMKKLDAGVPVPSNLSSEALLKRSGDRKRVFRVNPAVFSAVAAVAVLAVISAALIAVIGSGALNMKGAMSSSADFYQENSSAAIGIPQNDLSGSARNDAAESAAADKSFDNLSDSAEQAPESLDPAPEETAASGSPYPAGSYSALLDVVNGSLPDFAHVINQEKETDSVADDDSDGVIGHVVVSVASNIITGQDPEYQVLLEALQDVTPANVMTYGNKRVYSVYTEELGALVCIDDKSTGTLASVISLGHYSEIKRLVMHNDLLVVITDISENFGEISVGPFGVTLVDVFDISDGSSPLQTERYACEGDLFTVLADPSGVFVAIKRFAVDSAGANGVEPGDMSYVPMMMYNDTFSRIAPSDIYIAPEMASMDYIVVFRLEGDNSHALAYLGSADPLIAINYLIEKFK